MRTRMHVWQSSGSGPTCSTLRFVKRRSRKTGSVPAIFSRTPGRWALAPGSRTEICSARAEVPSLHRCSPRHPLNNTRSLFSCNFLSTLFHRTTHKHTNNSISDENNTRAWQARQLHCADADEQNMWPDARVLKLKFTNRHVGSFLHSLK